MRTITQHGTTLLLNWVNFLDWQQTKINPEPLNKLDAMRAALGDLVTWPDLSDDSDSWVEDKAEAVAEALSHGHSLTEIIMEERDSGW